MSYSYFGSYFGWGMSKATTNQQDPPVQAAQTSSSEKTNKMQECAQFDLLFHFSREKGDSTWEAHALAVDVVTYGDDLRDAVRMGIEAAAMVIADELNNDRDPMDDRALSNDEIQKIISSVNLAGGKRLSLNDVVDKEADFYDVVVNLFVPIARTKQADGTYVYEAMFEFKPKMNENVLQQKVA